jgi:hypothetical protein
MKKYSEVKNSKEFAEATTNKKFKSVQKGFPEGSHNVIVLGSDEDFTFKRDGKDQAIGMVKVLVLPQDATTLTDDTPCEVNRVVQASLASAIGCYSDTEWAEVAAAGTIFPIEAHRMAPATEDEYKRGKGKMKFTRRG